MKKYFSFGFVTLSVLALALLGSTGSAFAAGENPTTDAASSITDTDATLNATNGAEDATGHSFWASLNTFDTSSPTLPSGVFSTPDMGSVSSSTPFSALLSSVSGLGPITASTTYYYAGWSLVNGTWYPGSVENFTTLATPVAVTGVSLNATTTALTVGNTSQLTATVEPADATNQNVNWSSDNTGVASVDSNGLVTAVGEGTATITVTTVDGSYTATDAVTVSAASSGTSACNGSTFDTFTLGSVNGQSGWTSGDGFDEEVEDNTYGYTSFGCKVFRISNAVTSDGFGNQTFTPSVANEAGETEATNGGLSGGTRQNHFEAQFDFASTQSTVQPDLSVSVSPDRGDGSRMSYLSFNDTVGGIDVIFYDVQGTTTPANFVATTVATGLSRTEVHTAKFVIDYVDGPSNDVVKIYIDGNLVHTGTTWENYYRYDTEASAEQTPRTTDDLIFRVKGTAVPANSGKGFLFDNFDITSGPVASNYTLTYTAGANGTLVGTTTQTVAQGGNGTEVTAVPNEGYDFVEWSDGVTSATRTDTNVQGDISVTANFESHHQGGISSGSRSNSSGRVSVSSGNGGGQVLGAETFVFNTDLRLGMNNSDVVELQARLRAAGFFFYPTNTGYFGPITFAAVKMYQAAHPEIGYVTGFVGPLTRAVLNR